MFTLSLQSLVAQTSEPKTKRIEIVYGGEFTIDNVKYPGATVFKSDAQRVQFRHQGIRDWKYGAIWQCFMRKKTR